MEFLNEVDAARELGVLPQTLRKWRHFRRGPNFVRMVGRIKYTREALATFIDEQTIDLKSKKAAKR